MTNDRKMRIVAALIALGMALPSLASAQTVGRDIMEFVDAQGTFCIPDNEGGCFQFVPPLDNFLGWSDPGGLIAASYDYAGIADDYVGGAYGTSFSGSILETPLADGRAKVEVVLRTSHALTWVVDFTNFDFNDELLFGSRVDTIGGVPAFGNSLFRVTFINSAPGAPLPDLLQMLIFPEEGPEVLAIKFVGNAAGLLADGTSGRTHATQVGLFDTGFHGAVADGFPAENVSLWAVGN
jgi:hypothetical protein